MESKQKKAIRKAVESERYDIKRDVLYLITDLATREQTERVQAQLSILRILLKTSSALAVTNTKEMDIVYAKEQKEKEGE